MPTTTTTYSFNKPVVGADEDDWGGYLNGNWDSVDDLLDGTTPVTGIDINSGTLDGVTIGGTTAGAGTFTTLTATTSITGTLATAAQPNVTSLGTLTSLDVGGTVTADGLTVETASGATVTIKDTGRGGLQLTQTGGGTGIINVADANEALILRTNTVDRLNLASNGDISFYEDTGTTAKFFWDASAESLGIGTSSPAFNTGSGIEIERSGEATLRLQDTTNTANGEVRSGDAGLTFYAGAYGTSGAPFIWNAGGSERMRIDSSGNVGIGTSSPSSKLHLQGSTGGYLELKMEPSADTDVTSIAFRNAADNVTKGYVLYDHTSNYMGFRTNGSGEAMRIDSSGNLLVGQSSTAFPGGYTTNVEGVSVRGAGLCDAWLSSDGRNPLNLNRKTSDGDIAVFRKDGTTVGSIGTFSAGGGDNLTIGGGDTRLMFLPSSDAIIPRGTSDAARDDAIDLGSSSNRFDDIYATNGTIQTSDQNEKQDIAELSNAEQRVAVAAKGLLRKFRWKDAVAEKGDEARTHFGIIAQDLQAAFAAEGLDAGDYAMFIHSTWTDEETGEEKSRMGVRYSELLAFIIAAI